MLNSRERLKVRNKPGSQDGNLSNLRARQESIDTVSLLLLPSSGEVSNFALGFGSGILNNPESQLCKSRLQSIWEKCSL
jgi:hypothetical protein